MSSLLDMLLLSMAAYVVGGFLSLFFHGHEKVATLLSGLSGIGGGILGLWAILSMLIHGSPLLYEVYQGPFPFTQMPIRVDMLSAFMVGVISLLAIASSLYSLAYLQEYFGKGAWSMGFFMNIFIASMLALTIMDNAFYFIIFFEVMSLSSYFLVISEQNEEAVKAGNLYFFIAHAGSVLIMISFFLLSYHTPNNSLNFEDFRAVSFSPLLSSLAFLLAFFGFGAKAGIMPLHGWLPRAHPAAPSHASAMMSGVMVKIGVFGIIKVGIDLLSGGEIQLWWGALVLAFGAISAILGVLYALAENDIKRLLAYSTVENVGIILMGVGAGFIGLSLGNHLLATLGFLGALYHLLNHAIFKGVLFLGAGSIIYRLHSKDMNRMGGLSKVMPFTNIAFLVGCLSISALPPLNGFISEWYIYQALFTVSHTGSWLTDLAGPVTMVMLAITGALALMCFVKMYGLSFCGNSRSKAYNKIKEVPFCMVVSMIALAAFCVFLGVGSTWISPVVSNVAASLVTRSDGLTAAAYSLLVTNGGTTSLSPSVIMLLMLGSAIVPVLIFMIGSSYRLPFRRNTDAWACGYVYEKGMTHDGDSFVQGVQFIFAGLYSLRKTLDPALTLHVILEKATSLARRMDPVWDEKIISPIATAINVISNKIGILQQGDFRIYCLYILIALITLLLITIM